MHRKQVLRVIIGILAIMALTLILGSSAWAAGKYKTIHRFTEQTAARGRFPVGGLTIDAAGNLYGTTLEGGSACGPYGCGAGTVFELTPNGDGSWRKRVLHYFHGGDGTWPKSSLIFDAAGNLYGTTERGGRASAGCPYACGTVFRLTPRGDGSWVERVIHSFKDSDGNSPQSSLIFDAAGNLYGTTPYGGSRSAGCPYACGTVFKLTSNADGSWTESVLHSFGGSYSGDGAHPYSSLVFDAAGNLYGTTAFGGAQDKGTVFELTPNGDGSWSENVLHTFGGSDGDRPLAGLIFDAAGDLYGTTSFGGIGPCSPCGCGTVFKMTPNGDGSWGETVLHSFTFGDGDTPNGLTIDAAGNLYGTTDAGGNNYSCSNNSCGVVLKLTPNGDGSWTHSVLHFFQGTPGANPQAGPVLDQAGNLYGTTYGDITTTVGSVFVIAP